MPADDNAMPSGTSASADHAASSQPTADHAASSQPTADHAASSQPTADHAASSQPTADHGASSQPTADPAASSQPTADPSASGQPSVAISSIPEPDRIPDWATAVAAEDDNLVGQSGGPHSTKIPGSTSAQSGGPPFTTIPVPGSSSAQSVGPPSTSIPGSTSAQSGGPPSTLIDILKFMGPLKAAEVFVQAFAPPDITMPPGNSTAAGAQPTLPPGNSTAAGAQPTLPPGNPTAAGAQPTLPPGNPTAAGAQPTLPPGNPTAAGAQPTLPPQRNLADSDENDEWDAATPSTSGHTVAPSESNQSYRAVPGIRPMRSGYFGTPGSFYPTTTRPIRPPTTHPWTSYYVSPPSFNNARGGMSGSRATFTSSSSGGTGTFNNANPSKSYEKVPLQYTLAPFNAHVPDPETSRFRDVPYTVKPKGCQHFGAPTPDARIRKLELHPGHAFIIDTDNNKQKLQYETLAAHLQRVKAADFFSITSSTKDHAAICNAPGWTAFLNPVVFFTLDGWITVALVKKLFPRLPEGLRNLVFLPHQVVLNMPIAEAFNHIPKALQKLIFETSVFPDANLVTAVTLIPAKPFVKYDSLVLLGHRFPSSQKLPDFFERLEAITYPGASITLLTSNILNDTIVDSLINWGFSRVYLHRRTYGNLYECYQYVGHRRYLVGFLVKKEEPEDPEEDPYE